MEGLSGFPSIRISPKLDDFSTDYYQYTSEDYTDHQDQSWFGFAYTVAKGFNTKDRTRTNPNKKFNSYNHSNKLSPSSRNYNNYSHNYKSTSSSKYRFSTSFVKKYQNRLRKKLNDIPENKSDPQTNKLTVETLKMLHKFYNNTTSPQPLVIKHLKNKNKDTNDDTQNSNLMLFDNDLEPPPIMSTSQIIHPSNIDKQLKMKSRLKRSNSYPLLNEEKQYYIFDHVDQSSSLLFDTNFYKQNNIKHTQCDSDQKSHTSNDSKNSFARKMHHEFTSTIQSLMLQNYNNNVRNYSGCSNNTSTSTNKKNTINNNHNNSSKKSLYSNFVTVDHENTSVISDTSHISSNWSVIE